MRASLDAGRLEEANEHARQGMKSKDVAVRLETVPVLGRTGLKALPALSELMTDPDVTVRTQAFQQWRAIVASIPDEAKRSRITQAGLSVLDDPKSLDDLAALLAGLPKPLAVRSLANVIEAPNPFAAEAARAQYRRLTGAPYTSRADAEKWLQGAR